MRRGVINLCRNLEKNILKTPEIKSTVSYLKTQGVELIFGKDLLDRLQDVSLEQRVRDLNKFINDPAIDAIIFITGGISSNDVLDHIDYAGLKKSQKPVLGFSDATAVLNAVYAKTDVHCLHGASLKAFGRTSPKGLVARSYIRQAYNKQSYQIPNITCFNDKSAIGPKNKTGNIFTKGIRTIKGGNRKVNGTIVGGNLSTFLLLVGTPYMPSLQGKILFLEECYENSLGIIRRQLMQCKQLYGFRDLAGIVLGQFQRGSIDDYGISLDETIQNFTTDLHCPLYAGVPFGHVLPNIPFWVGGICTLDRGKITVGL